MKKIILLILVLSVSFLVMPEVKAATAERVPAGYYLTRRNPDGSRTSDDPITYINGNIVYCIEPGKKIGTNYYVDNNYEIESSKKLRILLIAYFGYNYGTNYDIKYAYAAQAMIWNELLNTGYATLSSKLWGEGTIYDISSYINDINNNIDIILNRVPNLEATDTLYVRRNNTIIDNNNLLNYFVPEDINNVKVRNNTLNVHFSHTGINSLKLKYKPYYNETYKIYTSNGYQTLLMPGDIPELSYTFNFEVMPSKYIFKPIDSITKEPVNNVLVSIQDEDYLIDETLEYIVNEDTIYDFKIKEVPEEYINNNIHYYLDAPLDEVQIIELPIDPIINDYTIYKTYDNEFPEENAIFELVDDNNKLIDVYKTDQNGEFNISLRYGDYKLNQLKGLDGYSLVSYNINNKLELNTKGINKIHLNDEKILINDLVEDINDELYYSTQPENLIQTGKEISLYVYLTIFSIILLLTKKIIAS